MNRSTIVSCNTCGANVFAGSGCASCYARAYDHQGRPVAKPKPRSPLYAVGFGLALVAVLFTAIAAPRPTTSSSSMATPTVTSAEPTIECKLMASQGYVACNKPGTPDNLERCATAMADYKNAGCSK